MKFESQLQIVTAAGVPPFTVNQTALVINLNADLLDGQHGSYYAAASSLGNYLPLTGGTLTGTLTGTVGIFTTLRATELTSLLGSNGPITITPDGTGHVHINSTDIRIGPNNTNATLATRGTGDLILRTHEGSAVEGSIRIYDGANGNIEITPNGTGTVVVGKLSGSTASFSGQITSTVATGTAPLVITSTTAVTNLNADLLDGQHASYFENRDATALGFSGGVLTITRAAGNLTANLDGRYLPLTGGTMSGDLTATRIRGVNSLVLNTFTTVNPASNVFLYSQPNDRDAWLFLDSADTASNWGIYHRQIDSAVSGLPANSIGFIGGGSSALQAWISLANGSANFQGALTQAGNQVLHAGNYTSYSPSLTGVGASGSWGIAVTGKSGALAVNDTRSSVTGPSTGTNQVRADFLNNATDGLNDGGSWHGVLTFQQWTDASGGGTRQLGFTDNDNLWIRGSGSALTAYNAWKLMLNSVNFSSYALPLSGGTITGNTTFSGDNHLTFGPNSTWSNSIRIGGNGYTATGTQMASVATTNGNLHLDSAKLAGRGVYLNWYGGTAGTYFGNGSSGQVGLVDGSGNASFSGTLSAVGAITQNGNQVLHAGNYTSYAIRSQGGLSVDISNTSLDTATTAGFFRGNAMTGAPDAGWWYIIVESHDLLGTSGWVKQTVTAYGSGNSYTAGTTFIRVRQGGSTWGGWIRELDSVNYNSFALPLTGGTLTGGLTGTSLTLSSLATLVNSAGTSYNENVRFPRANSGYVSLALACDTSGSGSIAGQFNIVVYPAATSGGAFAIRANNSDALTITTAGAVNIPTLSGTTAAFTGAITQGGNQVVHAGNVSTYAFAKSGSWAADLVTSYGFTRETGMQMTGGSEFAVLSKSGQGYLLVDGSYIAAEAGGFYSTNNSSGATLLGFYADTTASLNFNTTAVKLSGNQILHAATTSAPNLSVGGSAARWATGRTISLTGDVSGTSAAFDGTAALSFATTLANSGVGAGTYRSVTVNAKGLVTAGTNPTTISGYGITDAMYQVDPNGFTQGDINGSGNMQRLWGTDSVQNLIAFRPPTTVEYTTDNVNWVATTISNDVFDGKVFGKWAGFNMNVGSNIGAWTKVRMTWVNFGYHFFSHFTLCHSTNGHSMNFVFYKSDLSGVFSSEAYRVNGISSWPGYTFTSHVNVSGHWDTRDVRMVFELNGNNGPSGYPNNAISIGHIGIMGGYSSFNRVFDWDGNRNITLFGNLTLPGNVSATGTVSGSSFSGAGTNLTGTANSLNVGGYSARWATGRTIALTGDVTGTSGTFDGTANLLFGVTIANSSVTYAKIQNVAVSTVLGNSSASVAQAPQALSMATLAGMLSGQTMNINGSSASCTGNAATATNGFTVKPGWAGNQNLIAAISNLNNSVPSGFYEGFQATNSPTTGTWYNLINVRHSNTGNDHGFQLAMSYYDETLWSRSYQGGTGANNGTFTTWRAHLHSGNFSSYALPLTGGTMTGAITINGVSNAVVVQTNGNAAQWYGRVLCKNSTSDKSSFLGTYGSIAGVFAHNNALSAWADLYINTVDGSTGGTVRMPSSVLINGNQALHAGTTSAPSLSIGGSAAQLNGQAASYYENRDTTAVGFSGGTLTLTRAAGNLSVSLDGRYLTGNQTISLSGDLSGSGATSISATIAANAVTTTKINNSAVTYAKIQNVGAASVLGNTSASVSQAPQEITFANLGPYINGVARAWVTFNENPSTGAITINASLGISSVTRLAAGVYQVNFSTAFSDTHYAVSGTIGYESISAYTNGGYLALTRTATPKATTSCEVCALYGGTNYNARYVHVVFHR